MGHDRPGFRWVSLFNGAVQEIRRAYAKYFLSRDTPYNRASQFMSHYKKP
jgi:hypothetical protein